MSNTFSTPGSAAGATVTPAAPSLTPLPTSFGARAQADIAAAQAAHRDGAAFVKANAARLQALITPDLIAAAKDPVAAAVLRAKLAKATADLTTIDSRLAANLSALANQAARIKALTSAR